MISEDGRTSGIIVNIKKNTKLQNIENKTKEEIEKYRDEIKRKNHENILEIREVIKKL